MKRISTLLLLTLTAFSMKAQTAYEPMEQVVERGLQRAASQSLLLAEALKERKNALPRTFEKGEVQTIRYDHWVSGFFPGVLWMLYEDSGNQQLRQYAEMYTDRVEPAKRITNTLYLFTTALLPLGLPADDPFWAAPARDWTAKKAWNGEDVGADHAIR